MVVELLRRVHHKKLLNVKILIPENILQNILKKLDIIEYLKFVLKFVMMFFKGAGINEAKIFIFCFFITIIWYVQ